MPFINCKNHHYLNCTKNMVMSDNGNEDINDDTTFKITNTKLYVVLVTLSTEENVKLTK